MVAAFVLHTGGSGNETVAAFVLGGSGSGNEMVLVAALIPSRRQQRQ
jgi:hypothetical protein